MMKNRESSLRSTWYCHNCGTKVVGIQRTDGLVIAECSTCHTGYARTQRGRHHKSLEIYTSKYRPVIMGMS